MHYIEKHLFLEKSFLISYYGISHQKETRIKNIHNFVKVLSMLSFIFNAKRYKCMYIYNYFLQFYMNSKLVVVVVVVDY